MPMVSIIIPLHNSEAFIKETIQSCLNQSYQNIEVIVVENGSTDHSFKIVQGIKGKHIHLYKIEKANAAKARNYGFRKSTGDYVMFLDADDVLEPHKITYQIKALQEKPQGWLASCAWAKFTHAVEEAAIEEQAVWRIENPLEWLVVALTGGGMMIPGCWLLPRSLVEQTGGWDERLTLHDDGEFMCRVLLASKGQVFVDHTMVYYRQVPQSLSRQNQSFTAAQSALRVVESYEQQLLAQENNAIVKQVLAAQYKRWLYEFYPHYPKLLIQAQTQLRKLNVKTPSPVGGPLFQTLSKYLGFQWALKFLALKRS